MTGSADNAKPADQLRRDEADRAQREAVAHERLAQALRAFSATMSRRPDADMDAIANRMVNRARDALAQIVDAP